MDSNKSSDSKSSRTSTGSSRGKTLERYLLDSVHNRNPAVEALNNLWTTSPDYKNRDGTVDAEKVFNDIEPVRAFFKQIKEKLPKYF